MGKYSNIFPVTNLNGEVRSEVAMLTIQTKISNELAEINKNLRLLIKLKLEEHKSVVLDKEDLEDQA